MTGQPDLFCEPCAMGYSCPAHDPRPGPDDDPAETVGELHDQLGPDGSTIYDGWRITRWKEQP